MGIPYVALYPSDFLADIGHLGNTELGIYWRLVLVYYHDQKPFCNDLDRIRRVAAIHTPEEQKILNEILAEYFVRTTEPDGTITWHHVRCDREIDAAQQRHRMAVVHGKAGANKRWGGYRVAIGSLKGGNSNQNQNHNQKKQEVDTVLFDTEVSAEQSASPPLYAAIPLNDGTEFQLPNPLFKEFCELYPAVDIEQTLREIRGWCLANPTKRKTKRGVARFLNAWLSKEQNRG